MLVYLVLKLTAALRVVEVAAVADVVGDRGGDARVRRPPGSRPDVFRHAGTTSP